jgi:hypothetical protein
MEDYKITFDLAIIPKGMSLESWSVLAENKILLIDSSNKFFEYPKNPEDWNGYKVIDVNKSNG